MELTAGNALCRTCHALAPAVYEVDGNAVRLTRSCPEHGPSSSIVSSDGTSFHRAYDLAMRRSGTPPARGLIVDLLDDCNIRCATCIAGSGPGGANVRSIDSIARALGAYCIDRRPASILLSGGEPTIRSDLPDVMALVERTGVERRILITNGIRIARDTGYAKSILHGSDSLWEVFLQFDSLSDDSLRDIRGIALRRDRLAAVEELGKLNIPTTLVCVVKNGVNLGEMGELLDFSIGSPHVVGLQLQPIRNVGRAESFSQGKSECDSSMVVNELSRRGVRGLEPDSQSPLSVVSSRYSRDTDDWVAGSDHEWYVEPTDHPDGRLRVSVVEYSDGDSWTTVKSAQSPLEVLPVDRQVEPVSVDDYFVVPSIDAA